MENSIINTKEENTNLVEIVKTNILKGVKKFIVTYYGGRKEEKRLFVSDNTICEFKKNSRKYGYPILIDYIESILPKVRNEKDEICLARKNINKIIKTLSQSGLWQPMLECAKHFQDLSDDTLLSMKEFDNYNNIMVELREKGVKWWGFDCFLNLFGNGCIKAINYHKYEKEYIINKIKECINDKSKYTHHWNKKYDNSIELCFNDEYYRAWYSEEYKGCCNGYYYFMLNETHAIFSEKD